MLLSCWIFALAGVYLKGTHSDLFLLNSEDSDDDGERDDAKMPRYVHEHKSICL